ncbi:hypothetical protein HYS95_01595 [Candidatus Daviesbacteria bacterium]|nr:hypothetical protein [Candidatus Daviesbacteria bacterium]
MQDSFYASGFLYSLKKNKILLIHTNEQCSLLEGDSCEGEEACAAFQRIVNKTLNLNLKEKNIYPVYDYFDDVKKKTNYVFYAEVKNPVEFNPFEGGVYSWVSLAETSKLLFSGNAKQDVIVGERVIKAKQREEEAKLLPSLSTTAF